MAHFDYVRPSGQWSNELAPGANDYGRWDANQSRFVNGDAGCSFAWEATTAYGYGAFVTPGSTTIGVVEFQNPYYYQCTTAGTSGGTEPSWPTTVGATVKDGNAVWTCAGINYPMVVGGAGITFTSAGTLLSGGVETRTGGRVQLAAVPGNTPKLSSATDDTILLSCVDLQPPLGVSAMDSESWLQDDWLQVTSFPGVVGAQASVPAYGILPIPSRYLHDGASFETIEFVFQVLTKPTSGSWTPPLLGFGVLGANPTLPPPFYQALNTLFTNWLPSTSYPLGTYIVPTTGELTGYYYKATSVSGSSGTNAAIFSGVTTPGMTVVDGGITWTCIGRSGQLPAASQGTTAATYFNDGQPQSLYLDFDQAALAANEIDVANTTYHVVLNGLADFSANTLTNALALSVKITMNNITLLGFE
jgi:hypothetical protein